MDLSFWAFPNIEILIFAFPNFGILDCRFSSNIPSMGLSVSSPDETLRKELKIRHATEYFCQTSRYFFSKHCCSQFLVFQTLELSFFVFPNIIILEFTFSKHWISGCLLFQTLEFTIFFFPTVGILDMYILILDFYLLQLFEF